MKCYNCPHRDYGNPHFDYRSLNYHERCRLADKEIGLTSNQQTKLAPDWCPLKAENAVDRQASVEDLGDYADGYDYDGMMDYLNRELG